VAAVSIENTHMFAGGVPYELSELDAVVDAAQGRPVHMDGARLFNAVVATGISAADYGRRVTTVMTCVSKGLGAPMGSLLAGPSDLIASARIERKRLGGTMRQIGFMAAAGLVALDTMVDRLADDHARARRIAEVVASTYPESEYDPATCRTNIVAFNHPDARAIVARWRERGLLGDTVGPKRARLVTHKDLTDADVEATCHVIATSK
jgi:threonine aldolase